MSPEAAMKWSVVLQNAFVFVATLLVYLNASSIQQQLVTFVPAGLPTPAANAIVAACVPLVTLALYLLLALLIGLKWIRRTFDPTAKLIGQYFSVHKTGDTIAIFEISFLYFSRIYQLRGNTYSRNPVGNRGHWTSDSLEFSRPDLKYLYKGNLGGFAKITFNHEVTKGTGYFIEDKTTPDRTESDYVRITPKKLKLVLKRVFPKWRLRREKEEIEFIQKLVALPTNEYAAVKEQ